MEDKLLLPTRTPRTGDIEKENLRGWLAASPWPPYRHLQPTPSHTHLLFNVLCVWGLGGCVMSEEAEFFGEDEFTCQAITHKSMSLSTYPHSSALSCSSIYSSVGALFSLGLLFHFSSGMDIAGNMFIRTYTWVLPSPWTEAEATTDISLLRCDCCCRAPFVGEDGRMSGNELLFQYLWQT